MIDKQAEDYAESADLKNESIALMRKIEPCMHGHPRAIILVALALSRITGGKAQD